MLGVMRDVEPAYTYWLPMFGSQINFDTEFVDFSKLPDLNRKLAAFVRPMGRGMPVFTDEVRVYQFRPAYVIVRDVIDPLRPLTALPGIDLDMLSEDKMDPVARRNLLRAAMMAAHVRAIERRWEWMACQAIVNASIDIEDPEYPKVTLDFLRAANHTVTLSGGSKWGDSGVSIFDSIQTFADRMFNAEFGGFPTRLTITTSVWNVMRKDEEILKHMDNNYRNPAATVERGLISPEKVVKVGELMIGGGSGGRMEIMLYNDTYVNSSGVETRFLEDGAVVFTAEPSAIRGFRCFGRIIDPTADYRSLSIYPRNWMNTNTHPVVEEMLHQSAPLMVPVNPNATLKLMPV